MYFELDLRKIAIALLAVAITIIGLNYYEQRHPKPARTPIQTFYVMGSDQSLGSSNWYVCLYGADKTDFDELFKHSPLTALTNQVNYQEKTVNKDTDPFIEVYRRNPQSSYFLNDDNTIVIRRWCRDLPYNGEELARFIAEQIELSGLLPPPQS